jgi:hypothetical protein
MTLELQPLRVIGFAVALLAILALWHGLASL